jgi:MarR family transcriptional regulator for hemolysin
MAATEAPPQADLAFLLAQANHALATELTARLAELGITPRDQCVLSTALTDELTQNHLAELCALDKTTMVVTIDGLEKAGLAERQPSETDRRARIIAVTDKGARVVDQARAIIAGVYEDVLGELPERERAAFVGALTHLTTGRLSKPSPCERPPRRRAPRS